MKSLLFIPVLALMVPLFLALVIVAVLHMLFQGLHLHWLAANATSPVLDQFIRFGRWGRTIVEREQPHR